MILVYRQIHRQTGNSTVYTLDLSLEARVLGSDVVRTMASTAISAWSNATYQFEIA